jgi:hypothetical protein
VAFRYGRAGADALRVLGNSREFSRSGIRRFGTPIAYTRVDPQFSREEEMKKALGLMLALALTLSVSAAAAEDTWGTVTSINPESFTLADGTQLSLSGQPLTELSLGDHVLVSYEMKDGKKVVTAVAPDRMYEIQGV